MKSTVENDQHFFEFVDSKVKTEREDAADSNWVHDPISMGGNIHKEELDLNWDGSCGVDENGACDKLEDSARDLLTVTLPELRNQCTKKLCGKYKIDQSWLDHCYYRTIYFKCEMCPSDGASEDSHLHPSWKCKYCGEEHNSIDDLVLHNASCKVYRCNHCFYRTSNKYTLQCHMRNKHLPKPVCEICQKKIPYYTSIRQHQLSKCAPYKCDSCSYRSREKKFMRQHIFKFHMTKDGATISLNSKNPTSQACPRCGRIYKNRDVIKSHLQYCQKKFVHCRYCPYKTQRIWLFKRHVLSLHTNNATDEICLKCGEIFDDESSKKSHYFDCSGKASMSCSYCAFKTEYSLYLKKHLLKRHCKLNCQAEYDCPKCSLKLTISKTFRLHLLSCIATAYLQCESCYYKTKEPLKLTEHILQTHFKSKHSGRIPCSNCGTKLSFDSLKRHMKQCKEIGKGRTGRPCGRSSRK